MLSIFIVKNTPAARFDLQLFDSEESQSAVQLSALSDGVAPLHVGSSIAVAAQFSIGLTEARHRQFGAIALPLRAPRRRQDSVRSVVLDLHRSSSADSGAPSIRASSATPIRCCRAVALVHASAPSSLRSLRWACAATSAALTA
ncbi:MULTISPECIES: hypothetical protein [unclassified Bradyrhizobium]|uniref:hypothetical protein n=1 Tax=unclassified Bradyrhizobium TaxID=2631580 RepID=UPI0029160AC4|nr:MULTISPECIES: hypothetical protein [unclassified Bradyrhizobium]